jgi:hypothetical protein
MTHYCLDCETVFCGCCSEHTDHRYEILTMSTVATHMNDLKCLIHSSVEGPVVELHRALDTIHAVDSSLAINYAEAQNSIQETFDTLVQTVLQRRDTALAELNVVYSQKDQVLKNQVLTDIQPLAFAVTMCSKLTLTSYLFDIFRLHLYATLVIWQRLFLVSDRCQFIYSCVFILRITFYKCNYNWVSIHLCLIVRPEVARVTVLTGKKQA